VAQLHFRRRWLGRRAGLGARLTRKPDEKGDQTIGNFWVDLIRSIVYVLLPISVIFTLLLVSQGWCRPSLVTITSRPGGSGAGDTTWSGCLAGGDQRAGHQRRWLLQCQQLPPFESRRLDDFIEMLLILCIPAALTFTLPYGREPKAGLGNPEP